MDELTSILIFVLMFFVYIHVINHYKTSEDLEIYEMDYKDNKHLQEVCDVKQPVLFEFHTVDMENISKELLEEKYGTCDVKIKDVRDYYNNSDDAGSFVILSLQSSLNLVKSDPSSHYFSENNEDFIDESGLYKICKSFENYLKPSFICQTKYDILFGSKNTCTPMRYHMNYRQLIVVHSGKIQVKMTPWKSKKYLKPVDDYENYEFRSPINVWNPQSEYLHEMDKLHFLEFDVNAGHILYIPPYWWYSIKYVGENDTLLFGITYNSIMNCIAHLPDWGLYFLQQQNIKKKPARVHPVDLHDNENKEIKEEENNTLPVKLETIVEKL
jgi:hypothetical protein